MNPPGIYSALYRYSCECVCVGCRCSALFKSVEKQQILVQCVMSYCLPVASICRCVGRLCILLCLCVHTFHACQEMGVTNIICKEMTKIYKKWTKITYGLKSFLEKGSYIRCMFLNEYNIISWGKKENLREWQRWGRRCLFLLSSHLWHGSCCTDFIFSWW